MRSQLAEPPVLGRPEPALQHLPEGVVSLDAAEEAIELAAAYGVCDGHPLDDAQELTLRAAMGETAANRWAASTVVDVQPRQNGKNDTIAARELWGLIAAGERLIIHTAHEAATAKESFLRMVAVFQGSPDLHQRVAHYRYANGELGIELKTGQRLLYKTRTAGAVRGFTKVDLTVYDECQHLKPEHMAGSGPARLSHPNPQSWWSGSGGLSSSVMAWGMRRKALANEPGRYAYLERSAERVSLDIDGFVQSERPSPEDYLDPVVIASANPAFGRRNSLEAYEALLTELQPAGYARECLGIWDPEEGAGGVWPIPADEWHRQSDPSAVRPEDVRFALAVDPDRKYASVGVAWVRPDGGKHVTLVDRRPGVGWVGELMGRWNKPLSIDPRSPAAALVPALEADHVSVDLAKSSEYAAACGALFDGIVGGTVFHDGAERLTAAVAGAARRKSGEAWVWDQRNATADITPLVAATWALHALSRPVLDAAANVW